MPKVDAMGRTRYTWKEQGEVLEIVAATNSISEAARRFNIRPDTIRRWIRSREEKGEEWRPMKPNTGDLDVTPAWQYEQSPNGDQRGWLAAQNEAAKESMARRRELTKKITDADAEDGDPLLNGLDAESWAVVVGRIEARKAAMVERMQLVINELLADVLVKMQDSSMSIIIDALSQLLDRAERLTASVGGVTAYDGTDQDKVSARLVERLLDRTNDDPEAKKRVEHAVVESLKRRGILSRESVDDSSLSS